MPTDYRAISAYNEEMLGKDRASRMSQVSMYADTAHFVFEILQNADDAGAPDLLGHGEAGLAELLREDARGANLLHPELGVEVQVLVDRLQRRIIFVEQRRQARVGRGHVGRRLRARRNK